LPIYDRLKDSGGYFLKVEIAQLPDGQRILGVRIPHTRINQVLRRLGHGVTVTPADVLAGVRDGEIYELAGGLKLKKLVRAGQDRIEVVIPSHLTQRVWRIIQPHGGFNENIQHVFRYFIPNDERALAGVQALLKEFPVARDSSGEVEMAESKADLPSRDGTMFARKGSLEAMTGNRVHEAMPQQTPAEAKEYTLAELAKDADAIVVDGNDSMPAVVVGNWQAMRVIQSIYRDDDVLGFSSDGIDTELLIQALGRMGAFEAGSDEASARIIALRDKIATANELNDGKGFIFVVRHREWEQKRNFSRTLREELTHWEQAKIERIKSQELLEDKLTSHPAWVRIEAYLNRHYGKASNQIKFAEAAAKLMAGDRVAMLLSKEQAASWLAAYVDALTTKYGDRAIDVLRWSRRDILNALNNARTSKAQNKDSGPQPSAAVAGQDRQHEPPGERLPSRRAGSIFGGVESGISQRSVLFSRKEANPNSTQASLRASEARRLREKQKRTDTPDSEYRRIVEEESEQSSTKRLTPEQGKRVLDRLMTATVPVGAMLRSPSQILGRSAAGQKIYAAAEENWFLQERLNERWAKNWEKANKGLSKAEKNRIALYRFVSQIVQMRDEDSAREWLDSIGEDTGILDNLDGFLTPKEKAANEKWTKLFFEPSRKMSIADGLIDGKQQFDNYLSFYHDSTLRLNRSKIKDAAADLAREIGVPVHIAEEILEKANPKRVTFGSFDFTRQEWSIPGLRDADMIAEIYRKGFARKVAITRFLKVANPLTKKIADPALRLYARRYIAQYAGRPQSNQVMTDAAWRALMSKIPLLDKWQPSAGELAGWATAIQYNAKIGFNLFTPMLNLTQTVLNTMPYAGTRRTLAVLPRAMAAVALPNRLNPFVRDIARLHRGGIFSDDPGQSKFDRPVFHGVAETVQKAASFLFDKAESLNRATAYLAGLEMAKSEGLSGEAAVRRAREVVRLTQFYSGRLDAPLFSRTPGGKILMQFKTFTIKQLEFVGRLDRKQQAQFAMWTVALGGPASLLLVQAFQALFPDWGLPPELA
jgi:hypothetical protein